MITKIRARGYRIYKDFELKPNCHGKRIKVESLSVTFPRVDIDEFMQKSLDRLSTLLEPIAQGDFGVLKSGQGTDAKASRRNRAGSAARGRAVHAVSDDWGLQTM